MNCAADKLAFFDEARRLSLESAGLRINSRLNKANIVLALINDIAISAWRTKWLPLYISGQTGGWDWASEKRSLRGTISRFEVALWAGPVLCGLAIGKPSDGRSHLSVRLLEGNPDPGHPLKRQVARCLLEAAEEYAYAIEKQELRVINPLVGALPIYQALGFSIAPAGAKPPYWFVRL